MANDMTVENGGNPVMEARIKELYAAGASPNDCMHTLSAEGLIDISPEDIGSDPKMPLSDEEIAEVKEILRTHG